jgi:hypothetical protein
MYVDLLEEYKARLKEEVAREKLAEIVQRQREALKLIGLRTVFHRTFARGSSYRAIILCLAGERKAGSVCK